MRRSGLRALMVLFVVVGGIVVGVTSRGLAQTANNECLLEFQDASGSLPDGAMLTQAATRKKCAFSLRLCTNAVQPGCEVAPFATKKFHATGHCGPVAKLQVTASGSGSVCGAFTGLTVRTKSNGRKGGQCVIRAAVRSAKTRARTDVDKVTLVCAP